MAVPVNTVLPTITGSPASGATLTGHLGTWTNSPTSFYYEFRWPAPTAPGTKTIPGTTGTTASSATTPTYVMTKSDASRSVRLHVEATNASGTTTATSDFKIFNAAKVPFSSTGNPWTTALPAGVAIDTVRTTQLQAQLTSWYGETRKWWLQGGNYGDAYTSYLHVVDSSMARTPIVLINASRLDGPREPPVANSNLRQSLAYVLGVKNGGIPTPPGGFRLPAGNDLHLCVYVQDTGEYYETWVTIFDPQGTGGWAGQTPHPDYANQLCCLYGGYIRDVTTNPGYWNGDTLGSDGNYYKLDADGNREYAKWGAMATSLPFFQATMMTKELVDDAAIGHAIGVVTPGSNGSHVWPAQRQDTGSGGTLPQGGRWQLDPSINLAALPSLGAPNDDAFRLKVLTAAQTYGIIVCDSTGNDIILRMEAMDGVWPALDGVSPNGDAVSFDTLMQSVPTSSWRHVSPTYRPAGAPTVPLVGGIVDNFATLNTGTWSVFGGDITASGWLNLPVTNFTGMYAPDPRSIISDTTYVQLVQPAGDTYCAFYLAPSSFSNGCMWNCIGGNLIASLFNNGGGLIASQSTTYNATNHKWLRFRGDTTSIFFETSPGGGGTDPTAWTWTSLLHSTPDWDMSAVQTVFYVQSTVSSGTAYWDNLNTTGLSSGGSAGWQIGTVAWG